MAHQRMCNTNTPFHWTIPKHYKCGMTEEKKLIIHHLQSHINKNNNNNNTTRAYCQHVTANQNVRLSHAENQR